jgi:arylformamidase
MTRLVLTCLTLVALLFTSIANAGLLRDRIEKHMQDKGKNVSLPQNIQVTRDVAYGQNPKQHLDIYAPANPKHSPIIVMVHGGAWKIGDKTMGKVFLNKVNRWGNQNFIFISINYPMLPEYMAYEQAESVATAIAYVQKNATQWGGNPDNLILMGHSAGAHIVSLLSSNPQLVTNAGGSPWLGTVSLDSAAMDVPKIMSSRHLSFYDEAFGTDPSIWQKASPYHQLTQQARPLLAVCSTQRADKPCTQADNYAAQAKRFNIRVEVLPQDLSHGEINDNLGLDSDYTRAVERFMATLNADIAAQLSHIN